MNSKQVVFFDLDHTLWDYETNAHETLSEVYQVFDLNRGWNSPELFIESFHEYNHQLWDLYNFGKIDRAFIREKRFVKILDDVKLSNVDGIEVSDFFISSCPQKSGLLPGAINILEYLATKYELAIITNGFTDTQSIKIKSSGLENYFEIVVTSENANARKPSAEIFEYAMALTNSSPENAVMIGDNLKTDIEGALAINMKAIWLTDSEVASPKNCSKIKTLAELESLL